MTKQAKKQLKAYKVPAVRWSEQYNQYWTRIGYSRSKGGKRQRKVFYLGKDEGDAVRRAAALKDHWREIRKQGPLAVWQDNCLAPSAAMATKTTAEIQTAISALIDEQTADAIESGTAEWQTPKWTFAKVRDAYLEYRRGKLGIGGGQGINDKTLTNESRNLKSALAGVETQSINDYSTYSKVEMLKDGIFRRAGKGEISRRTANNYWTELKRMLDWAHRDPLIDYRHPEDVGELFKQKFRNPNPVKIAEYDAEKLKTILAKSTDRQRLYIYLALNCGMYAVDIGSLKHTEIIEQDGNYAICRKRNKTSHQNDFSSLHTLWPETYALLMKELSPSDSAYALLTENGTPLYRSKPHCDCVGDTYLALQRKTVRLSFKQYRKMGATAIQRIGGDEARRLYKAGAIGEGDKVYVIEAREKLTPHLRQWGDELRQDGILY